MNTTITVQDSEGKVLSGAMVSYLLNAVTAEGTTDKNGQVIIAGLAAGTYTFTASLSGYTSTSADVTVDGTTDATGTITMTAETTSATATLKSAATTVVVSTLTEKIAELKVKIAAKIAATHSWEKLGWLILSALLDTGSEWAISYVESKLS